MSAEGTEANTAAPGRPDPFWNWLRQHHTGVILTVAAVCLYFVYVNGITQNPPGFYIDETLAAYNAYQLYLTGQGEFGHFLPLYFPVLEIPPPHYYLGYIDPVQIYALAGLYFVFPPSNGLARMLSATATFLACVVLAKLAARISGSLFVGVGLFVSALLSPWLFQTGRLAFSASLYPLGVALFLYAVYAAHRHEKWPALNIAAVAATLALLTYTYSIGRLLGPLMAVGLILFAVSRQQLLNVVKTWAAYGVTLVPMAIFHFRNPGALAGRFSMTVGVIAPGKSYTEIATEFLANYAANLSPYRMLFTGDPNMRHNILDNGPVLAATLILAVAGLITILVFHLKSPWWRFVIFGLAASVVPASLTKDQFHMLRLIALPVFMLVLLIPVLMFLTGTGGRRRETDEAVRPRRLRMAGYAVASLALVFTLIQGASFQKTFAIEGPKRDLWFDVAYPNVVKRALESPLRPIYLVDGYWGQMYAHAYWYAIVNGMDRNTFVHVKEGTRPPPGSLVISSEDKCTNCQMILKEGNFLLYREGPRPPAN